MAEVPPPFASILCAVGAGERHGLLDRHGGRAALAPALQAAALTGVATKSLSLRATDVHEAILAVASRPRPARARYARATAPRRPPAGQRVERRALPLAGTRGTPRAGAPPLPGGVIAGDRRHARDGRGGRDHGQARAPARRASCCCTPAPGSRATRNALAEETTALLEATGVEPVTLQLDGTRSRPRRRDGARAVQHLIVTGSELLTGIRALGSVSERIATTAPCSVLVVRH